MGVPKTPPWTRSYKGAILGPPAVGVFGVLIPGDGPYPWGVGTISGVLTPNCGPKPRRAFWGAPRAGYGVRSRAGDLGHSTGAGTSPGRRPGRGDFGFLDFVWRTNS